MAVITEVVPFRLTRRRAFALAGAATASAALRPESAAASFTRSVPLTGAPQRAGRFDLIGLDFGRAAHVHAEVRARLGRGPWTAWTPVHDATQPVWTGPADTFQVRHTGVARRLQARLTRTGPAPRITARGARQSGGQPPIIARSAWGGDKVPPRQDPIYGEVQAGFVHHTVTANDYGPEDSAGIVLGIARYHRDHNGWNDIGYQFLVDKYGQIFEGRAGGIELAIVGAQAQGYNSVSTGVSCLGDYTSGPLTEEGLDAVSRLLAWKLSLHGVPVTGEVTVVSQGGETNRYAAGRKVTLQRISGHRDGDATSCPGEALYAQLDDIRARASRQATAVAALTIATGDTKLRYPDGNVDVTGTLRLVDGTSPAGQPVSFEYQKRPGAPWAAVAGATTDAAGAFAAPVPVPGSGRVRAVAAGLRSSPVSFTVIPRLTLSLSPRRLRFGRRTRITASVEPATITRATLIVERRVGSRYYRVSRRKVTFVDGQLSTTFRPPRTGRFRVTLQARGSTIARLVRAVSR